MNEVPESNVTEITDEKEDDPMPDDQDVSKRKSIILISSLVLVFVMFFSVIALGGYFFYQNRQLKTENEDLSDEISKLESGDDEANDRSFVGNDGDTGNTQNDDSTDDKTLPPTEIEYNTKSVVCTDEGQGDYSFEASIPEDGELSFEKDHGSCVFVVTYGESKLEVNVGYKDGQIIYSSVNEYEILNSNQAGSFTRGKTLADSEYCHLWRYTAVDPSTIPNTPCELYAYGNYYGEDTCYGSTSSEACPSEIPYGKYSIANGVRGTTIDNPLGVKLRLRGVNVGNDQILEVFDNIAESITVSK